MALFSMSAAADALEDLLDHERKMILAGQIDGLLRVGQEKERLLARLPHAGEKDAVIERLRLKAERNQQLLVSAARGIRSAARRVEALKNSSTDLRTYGRDGAAASLTGTRGGVNRHA